VIQDLVVEGASKWCVVEATFPCTGLFYLPLGLVRTQALRADARGAYLKSRHLKVVTCKNISTPGFNSDSLK